MKFAKWIWENTEDHPDEYVCFYKQFETSGEQVSIEISCDSNYELYVNGKIVSFGQYSDYPYDKVYDCIDLTTYCQKGNNYICILVWYYGKDFFTYYKGTPGLIYEITEFGEHIVAFSDEATLCKKANDYISGVQKIITSQLGFSYTYDMRGYDRWRDAGFYPSDFSSACVVEKPLHNLHRRPIEKLILKSLVKAKRVKNTAEIYNLGMETVGYLAFRLKAPYGTQINISYGEHLIEENGVSTVPRIIGGRDFSMDIVASGDWFEFTNYMRRLGCRYLQISSNSPVEVDWIGIYPTEYPVSVLSTQLASPLRQKIYDTAVHTLRCCMFEHYEDCPWREQALYNVDSRNQMLCTYYALGDFQFARASLDLMGKDCRTDGLLHICFPSKIDLVIPFFSLFYIIQMREYAEYSGDKSLIFEHYEKMSVLLDAFRQRYEDGLITNFYGERKYWNFYEWNDTLDGRGRPSPKSFDLILNTAYSMALQSMAWMANNIGLEADGTGLQNEALKLNQEIRKHFYSTEKGLYRTVLGTELYSELGNAFAILSGAAGEEAQDICYKLTHLHDMIPATLSMKAFLYDALLGIDQERYSDWVINDIDQTYSYMLEQGATSFWETIDGAKAFENAGSLCHGWSAIPIIYYHRLLQS